MPHERPARSNPEADLLQRCKQRLEDARVQLEFATENEADERRCHSALTAFMALTQSVLEFLRNGQSQVPFRQVYDQVTADEDIRGLFDYFERSRNVTLHRDRVVPRRAPNVLAYVVADEEPPFHWYFDDPAMLTVDGEPIDALYLCGAYVEFLDHYLGWIETEHAYRP